MRKKVWSIGIVAVLVLSLFGFINMALADDNNQNSWTIQTVDFIGDYGQGTSLAIDENGFPHISYYESVNGDLKYARWTGSEWQTQIVDSSGYVGEFSSIALDSSGQPHIVYLDNTNSYLKYAKYRDNTWSFDVADTGVHFFSTSIALDSNNYPHVSYCDFNNDELKYAKWTGSSWEVEVIDSTAIYSTHTSIALDNKGYPHISYYRFSFMIYDYLNLAKWTGNAWSIETVDIVDDPGAGFVTSVSMAIDSNGNSHIVYFNNSDETLKYASSTGSNWNIEIVENLGDSGEYASIAVDNKGIPHIGYHYPSGDSLKYAIKENDIWNIETVDTASGIIGWYPSIAIDHDGIPQISYYDMSTETVKYAIKGPMPTTSIPIELLWWSIPIIATIIIGVCTVVLIKRRRKGKSPQTQFQHIEDQESLEPEADDSSQEADGSAPLCPNCGQPMIFSLKQRDWRCDKCEENLLEE